jgi:bifunctional pyridoxal-dependent enzyme with beta-cystathionase and maltose regulon repressor activities
LSTTSRWSRFRTSYVRWIARQAAPAARAAPAFDFDALLAVLAQRRDALREVPAGLPVIVPQGGCSALLDCRALGRDAATLSEALLAHGMVAATQTG